MQCTKMITRDGIYHIIREPVSFAANAKSPQRIVRKMGFTMTMESRIVFHAPPNMVYGAKHNSEIDRITQSNSEETMGKTQREKEHDQRMDLICAFRQIEPVTPFGYAVIKWTSYTLTSLAIACLALHWIWNNF